MKLHSLLVLVVCSALVAMSSAAPLGTSFSYQGRLTEGGASANGLFDLTFGLFDAPTNGVQAASAVELAPVAVSNGLFAVSLDFGPGAFDGNARWLEIAVTRYGTDQPLVILRPRQPVKPAPYAIYASTAGSLSMPVPDSLLSSNVARLNASQIFTGVLDFHPVSGAPFEVGNSNRVNNLNADMLDGLDSTAFWKLGGNNGTIPGTNFIGTTDDTALEFKVNKVRALRVESHTNSPNIIGGFTRNTVAAGVYGATISGGGGFFSPNIPSPNRVMDSFGTIGGGVGNIVGNNGATVSGGRFNNASGPESIIAGGFANQAGNQCFVGGGVQNTAWGYYSTVGGGQYNLASSNYSAIAGGEANTATNYFSTICGGRGNTVSMQGGFVGAGLYNMVSGEDGVIAGGFGNLASGDFSFIGGGYQNAIGTASPYSTIAGGSFNTISNGYVSICGGFQNSASGSAAAIAGGVQNVGNGTESAIGGGAGNTSRGNLSTVGGGCYNLCSAYASTISGGSQNTNMGQFGVVPGGQANSAVGDFSFAAGYRAKANHIGSFVWGDFTDSDVSSSSTNQFVIRATGGVKVYSDNNVPLTGVELSSGSGSWSSLSDRAAKTNVVTVDGGAVLNRLAALPIAEWSYKSQDASVRHIGPMAQDFKAAFGVGEDDRHITTVDADGVALAAIQGLNSKLKEKEAEIETLKERLASLELRVSKLH